MCIDINMSIIEKVFHYEESELSVIKHEDEIWFRGKTIAEILGYSNPLKAIRMHIDYEDKREILELEPKSRGAHFGHRTPLRIDSEGLSTLMNPVYIA